MKRLNNYNDKFVSTNFDVATTIAAIKATKMDYRSIWLTLLLCRLVGQEQVVRMLISSKIFNKRSYWSPACRLLC